MTTVVDGLDESAWLAKLGRSGVPVHLREGLTGYVLRRIPAGSFLEAVMSNDLMRAFALADEDSREGLFELCKFIHNTTPAGCHGSPERVAKWLEGR